MGQTIVNPSHLDHIWIRMPDHTRECNDDILMKSETKKTNILTKKHTARPDSQNCSRSVTGDLGVRRGEKTALVSRGLRSLGAATA